MAAARRRNHSNALFTNADLKQTVTKPARTAKKRKPREGSTDDLGYYVGTEFVIGREFLSTEEKAAREGWARKEMEYQDRLKNDTEVRAQKWIIFVVGILVGFFIAAMIRAFSY